MQRKHPTKDCIHPKCKLFTSLATSKTEEQKFPSSKKYSLDEIIFYAPQGSFVTLKDVPVSFSPNAHKIT